MSLGTNSAGNKAQGLIQAVFVVARLGTRLICGLVPGYHWQNLEHHHCWKEEGNLVTAEGDVSSQIRFETHWLVDRQL